MSCSQQRREKLLITTYQEVKIAFDQKHVAMTKTCESVAILTCQSNIFQKKNNNTATSIRRLLHGYHVADTCIVKLCYYDVICSR